MVNRKAIEIASNFAILLVCGLFCYTLITHKSVFLSAGGGGQPERRYAIASAGLPLGGPPQDVGSGDSQRLSFLRKQPSVLFTAGQS